MTKRKPQPPLAQQPSLVTPPAPLTLADILKVPPSERKCSFGCCPDRGKPKEPDGELIWDTGKKGG